MLYRKKNGDCSFQLPPPGTRQAQSTFILPSPTGSADTLEPKAEGCGGEKHSHILFWAVIHRTSQPYMDSHSKYAFSLGSESRDMMNEIVPSICRAFGLYLHLKVLKSLSPTPQTTTHKPLHHPLKAASQKILAINLQSKPTQPKSPGIIFSGNKYDKAPELLTQDIQTLARGCVCYLPSAALVFP